MTDTPESARQGGEQQDLPNSDASQTDSGQHTSQGLDLDTIVKSLREDPEFLTLIDDRAERKAQSTKDRRISKLETEVTGFNERLDRYEQLRKEGRSPEQARQQLQFEDDTQWLRRFREKTEGTRTSTQAPQGSGEGLSDNVKAVLTALKIDADNPEVVKALQGKSYVDAVNNAVEISNRLRASDEAIDESQIAPPKGGPPPVTNLDREYVTKLKELQGNRAAIKRLQAEYRQKGVNVDGVIVRVE